MKLEEQIAIKKEFGKCAKSVVCSNEGCSKISSCSLSDPVCGLVRALETILKCPVHVEVGVYVIDSELPVKKESIELARWGGEEKILLDKPGYHLFSMPLEKDSTVNVSDYKKTVEDYLESMFDKSKALSLLRMVEKARGPAQAEVKVYAVMNSQASGISMIQLGKLCIGPIAERKVDVAVKPNSKFEKECGIVRGVYSSLISLDDKLRQANILFNPLNSNDEYTLEVLEQITSKLKPPKRLLNDAHRILDLMQKREPAKKGFLSYLISLNGHIGPQIEAYLKEKGISYFRHPVQRFGIEIYAGELKSMPDTIEISGKESIATARIQLL